MGERENTQAAPMPEPDPALKRLERLVGTWEFTGRTVGSEVDNVFGRNTFEWLPGRLFLLQRIDIEFVGQEVAGIEVIGYDPETDSFPSTVYSNFSPTPLPYRYEVDDERLEISVSYGPIDATFTGAFGEDGRNFSGGWRPNPGADETVNVPYDLTGTRVE
jgi:Protein of unknown function (DUF1579)